MPDIYISHKEEIDPKELKKKKKGKKGTRKESLMEKKNSPYRKRKSVKRNPFLAYSFMPKNVDFETRDSGEKVVLLLRRHPITNIKWILILVLMVLAPTVLSVFPILEFLPGRFQFIAILGWYLTTTAFLIENFLTWFFNVNIVTDERIIDIDFHNLIYKEVSETKIDQIQDVTLKMGGAVRTVFNYGDLYIQTAGEVPNFDFLGVPKPDRVAKIIQELRTEEEVEKIEGRIR